MGCVMFGREREQPGVILEPSSEHAIDPTDRSAFDEFRDKIWSVDDYLCKWDTA